MWTNRIDKLEHMEDRRAEFLNDAVNKTKHGIVVDLVEMLLRHDPSIRSVVEVGVYLGDMYSTTSPAGTLRYHSRVPISVEILWPSMSSSN